MLQKLLIKTLLSQLNLPRDIHRRAFRKYGKRVFAEFPTGPLTYKALKTRSYKLVQAWSTLGLKKGDVVFAKVKTSPEFFEIRTAALETGILVTVFHEEHTAEFMAFAASKAKPKLYISQSGFGCDCGALLKSTLPNLTCWNLGPSGEYEKQISLHLAIKSKTNIDPKDPMALGFTSGTTGTPKGLLSSHYAAVTSLKLLIQNLDGKRNPSAANIALTSIPMVGAGSGLIFPTFMTGGSLIFMDTYSPENLCACVKKYGVTRLFVTPSHLIDILDMPQGTDSDLQSVTQIIYGTSSMPAAKLEEAIKRFGPIFQQGYGQAEVLPPVSFQPMSAHMQDGEIAPRDILQSSGKVVMGVEVRIVDREDEDVSTGAMGQILVNTPTRFSSYLDKTQNDDAILPGGFFRTGDYGYLDAENYLHVINRAADLIDTESGKIFPRFIEEIAHDHPAVKECCMVLIAKSPTLVVSIRAAFTSCEKARCKDEILSMLDAKISDWEMPTQILFVDEIPRSFLGKILRGQVKEIFEHGS